MFNKKLKKEIAKINEQVEILTYSLNKTNEEYLGHIAKLQNTINLQKNVILKSTKHLHPYGFITIDKTFIVINSNHYICFEKTYDKYCLKESYQRVWLVNLNDTFYRFDATNLPTDFPERISKIEDSKIITKNNEEWFIDFKANKIKPITSNEDKPVETNSLFSQTLRNLNKYER